jgi:hypothetical protein
MRQWLPHRARLTCRQRHGLPVNRIDAAVTCAFQVHDRLHHRAGRDQTECLRGCVFATRAEANPALFEYADGFHNPRRIRKRRGCPGPIASQEKHCTDRATAEPVKLKPRHLLPTGRPTTPAQRGKTHPPANPSHACGTVAVP